MKRKTLNKGIGCATYTAQTSQYVPISISRTEKKITQATKHEFQPVHISEAFFFVAYQNKAPTWEQISLSLDSLLAASSGHQSFTSFGPYRRINLQPLPCPLPGSWWKDKAGIQTPIPSPTLMPTSCHHCQVSEQRAACENNPLLADLRKQGTGPDLKEIKAEGEKELIQQ